MTWFYWFEAGLVGGVRSGLGGWTFLHLLRAFAPRQQHSSLWGASPEIHHQHSLSGNLCKTKLVMALSCVFWIPVQTERTHVCLTAAYADCLCWSVWLLQSAVIRLNNLLCFSLLLFSISVNVPPTCACTHYPQWSRRWSVCLQHFFFVQRVLRTTACFFVSVH